MLTSLIIYLASKVLHTYPSTTKGEPNKTAWNSGDKFINYNRIYDYTYHHAEWCKKHPTDVPELVRSDAHHLMHAFYELIRSKYPRDGDGLEEADPEKRHSACRIKVHELKDVGSSLYTSAGQLTGTRGQLLLGTYMSDHRHAQQEHENADAQCEFAPVRTQQLRPVVHHASHKRFHYAELAVNAENLKK